jgi:hypothetical protein
VGQAVSYIVTAWEALAAQKQTTKKELPVVFEDVKVHQAIQADVQTPVTLHVSLDHSNRFQVCYVMVKVDCLRKCIAKYCSIIAFLVQLESIH